MLKKILAIYMGVVLVSGVAMAAPKKAEIDGVRCASEKDYQWWRDARFGIFIHWGPGALVRANAFAWPNVPGRRPWHELGYMADHTHADEMSLEDIKKNYKFYGEKDYRDKRVQIFNSLYKIFNPTKFDADAVAQMAVDAGAGYIVLTTKHHDGFCMWDSAYTDHDIMSTPFKRDICKELADACHKRGIRVLWYYSILDMYEATYDTKNIQPYEDHIYNQVKELMSNYGSIEGIWWDGGAIKLNQERLFKMINTLHPGALTNGRIGAPVKYGISFSTPEQRTGAFQMDRPWETCAVIGGGWFWSGGKYVKSIETCLRMLVDCAIGDGNLLLNFGMPPDGKIIPKVKRNYLAIGDFLKKYGESIYKTRGGPYKPGNWGGATRHGKTIYLHIMQRWPIGELRLPPLPAKVLNCEALTGGNPVCKQTDKNLIITMDPKEHVSPDTIIKLTLDSDSMAIEPITTQTDQPLTLDAKVTASSPDRPRGKRGSPETVIQYSFETGKIKKAFGEESSDAEIKVSHKSHRKWDPKEKERIRKMVSRTHRGHFWRYWQADRDDKQPWIAVDMGREVTFQKVGIKNNFGIIQGFELQAEKDGKWETFYKGESFEDLFVHLKKPVTARRVRLLILGYEDAPPQISMFDVF